MVVSDRTKGCCSIDLNEPHHPHHDQLLNLTHTTLNSPLPVDGPEVIGNRITPSPTGNPTSLQVRCGHLFNLMHGKDKQYAGRFFIAVQEAMRDIAGASTA
jgi:hypothetical protein